jgi:hypothetical protein
MFTVVRRVVERTKVTSTQTEAGRCDERIFARDGPDCQFYEKNQSTSKQQTNNSQQTVGPAVAGSAKERKA